MAEMIPGGQLGLETAKRTEFRMQNTEFSNDVSEFRILHSEFCHLCRSPRNEWWSFHCADAFSVESLQIAPTDELCDDPFHAGIRPRVRHPWHHHDSCVRH